MFNRKMNKSRQDSPDARSNMLDRLRLEHEQLLRKLNLLESQYLEMCRGRTPDYSLMHSVIVYIQEYPEQIHHPLEDMMYSILLERADDAEYVQKLISDHTKMEEVTREIRESLESLPGGAACTEQLKQQLSEFLTGQRQHIYTEESGVFPLVESALTEKDWKRLEYMTPILDEPISGKRTWNDYQRLSREIDGMYGMQYSGGVGDSLDLTETKRRKADINTVTA